MELTDAERKEKMRAELVDGAPEELTIPLLLQYLETISILVSELVDTADFFEKFYKKNVTDDETILKDGDMFKGVTAYHNVNLAYLENRAKDLNMKGEILMDLINEKRNEDVGNG